MKLSTTIIIIGIVLITGVVVSRMIQSKPNDSPRTERPAAQSGSMYEPKEHEGGNVTVSVSPLTLKPGFPPSFDIAFETHSVELDFDVIRVAALTDNTGTAYTPFWEGSPPGGHHRNGTLRFTPNLTGPATITLAFSDIAGIPLRTFSWEVLP